MFDLDKAIAAWRRTLEHRRAFSDDDLEELEGHVRDAVEARVAAGEGAEAAFRAAVRRFGEPGVVEGEYRKTYWPRLRHRRRLAPAILNEVTMLASYLKTALRNLSRHRAYTAINLLGLAVGIACCLLLALYVAQERSVDAFHTRADRLYRLVKRVTPQEGGEQWHAISSGQMGPTMVADFPEVETVVRLLPWFDDVLTVRGETAHKLADVVIADSHFFQVFDFRLLRGDPAAVLRAPMSIVLTESTARLFFGDDDPVGQTLVGLFGETFTVTGVAADAPEASHLRFNALVAWSSTVPGVGALDMAWMNNWLTQAAYTFVLLAPGADAAALEARLPAFMQRHFASHAAQYHLALQPFRDIYLRSTPFLYQYGVRLGNELYLYVFSGIAFFILVIACINFTNLSTARAARRAREVGMRKVLGAHRSQLIRQFLGESVLLSLLAAGVALGLVAAALPGFGRLSGRAVSFALVDPALVLGALLLVVAGVGVAGGLYPAFVLSAYRPVRVLKGGTGGAPHGRLLRRVLVTLQFTLSTALIAGTLVVSAQIRYMQRHDLGFDREHLVSLPIGETRIAEQFDAFKARVLQHPNVLRATGSQGGPGLGTMGFGLLPEGKPETETWTAPSVRLDDYDFLETFGLEMAAGRFLSPDHPTDATNGVVINEALARALGWDDPVGKRLDIRGEVAEGTVIGVVKDFHVRSLHQAIEPLVLYVAPRHADLTLRLSGDDLPGTLAFLREQWEAFEAQYPFEYRFLDDTFAAYYEAEQRMLRVVGVFAGLAIAVACLGLFGLAAFTAEQRTKEIGIRKVMGATVPGLVGLLSQEVVRLVAVAFVLGAPLAYLATYRWLEGFAYRIDLAPGPFVLAGLATLAVALATVASQAVKAALADPVKALRYE